MTTPMTVEYPPVSIANSQLRSLRSSIVGQEYLIKIRLPETYAESTAVYPVLYLLDGDHAFAMATDIVQYLIYGGHIPDLLIISPAYGSKSTPPYGGTNMRDRDLAPFLIPGSDIAPGAAQFLQFFHHELIPYVESNYRIDATDRTLWGYSAGGDFVLYALFQTPALFQRYIVVDAFEAEVFELEESYATQYTNLAAKLFVGARLSQRASDLAKFLDILQRRKYPNLNVEYAQLNDISHFAVGAEGLTKGLVNVFRM
jgi:hypothetical protein